MTTYQILYWQDQPSAIRAESGAVEAKAELPSRFQERIDAVATERGAVGTDAYLDGWTWSDPETRDGSPEEVVSHLQAELEAGFPEQT